MAQAETRLTRQEFLRWVTVLGAGISLAACGQAATSGQQSNAVPAATTARVGGTIPVSTTASTGGSATATTTTGTASGAATTIAPASGVTTGATSVRLVAWADVQDKDVYTAVAAAIARAHPNLAVSVEQYPKDYYTKVQTNFAGGTAADVIYVQGWMWQPYAEGGSLAPLDALIARDHMGSAWPALGNYTNMTTWHGKTYMSPTDVGSLVMFYNKDLFDKKGLAYPKTGWTYEDDFKRVVEGTTFNDQGKTIYGFAQTGYGRNVVFMRRNGQQEWDRPVEPTKAQWTQPDVVSALQYTIADVIGRGFSPGPPKYGDGASTANGRIALTLEGPWNLPNMSGPKAVLHGGVNYDVVEPPVGSDGYNHNFAHVHGYTISSQTKIKDDAWQVLSFILGDDAQKIIAEGGRMCGTPENIQKIWAPIATKAYNFQNAAAFINGMKQGSTPLLMGAGFPINAYGGPIISSLQSDLSAQKKTAQEAVAAVNPQIQALLDTYWQQRQH